MDDAPTTPPVMILPPFSLPDGDGTPHHTVRLRGRRHLALLFLSPADPDAPTYLQSFAARREEWAWLHTQVLAVVPAGTPRDVLPALPFPVLRDDGRVRAGVLPGIAPEVAALLVADQQGQVAAWRTARRVLSLPDVDTALAWAWEVARPKEACSVVPWSPTANPAPPPPAPAPIGRFVIGARSHVRYRGRAED